MTPGDLIRSDDVGVISVELIVRSIAAEKKILRHDRRLYPGRFRRFRLIVIEIYPVFIAISSARFFLWAVFQF